MDTPSQSTHNEERKSQARLRRPRPEVLLNEQEMSLDPFPWYRTMRISQPVFYDKENQLWHVFSYDEALRILTDPITFSSEVPQRLLSEEERKNMGEPSILSLDPPRHRQLRALISQAFTPRTIARLASRITEIVNEHLDQVAASGRMDVIANLAYPLPVIVIAELLGLPAEDRAMFKHWSDIIVSPQQEEAAHAGKEMGDYLRQVTDQRRVDSRDDLISALLAAQVDGEHLNEGELLSFYGLLLVAGNETTTNLIGNAIICFDENPQVMEQLRADPELLPGAIEEVLRYRSPVQRLIRVVTTNTTVGGQQVKEDELISPWIGAVNRDEQQFPNAEVFDIRRSPNRHIGFGHGIHFCIGAPLARLESKIALACMLERFSDIKRDRAIPLERIPATSAFFGVQKLPITLARAS